MTLDNVVLDYAPGRRYIILSMICRSMAQYSAQKRRFKTNYAWCTTSIELAKWVQLECSVHPDHLIANAVCIDTFQQLCTQKKLSIGGALWTPVSKRVLINAAARGDIVMFEWLVNQILKRDYPWDSEKEYEHVAYYLVWHGYLSVMFLKDTWYVSLLISPGIVSKSMKFSTGPNYVQQLQRNSCASGIEDMVLTAATLGHIKGLEGMLRHVNHDTWFQVSRKAVIAERFEVLQWMFSKRLPISSYSITIRLAQQGRLDILQWLRTRRIPEDGALMPQYGFGMDVCYQAALNGHLEILKWVRHREQIMYATQVELNNTQFRAYWNSIVCLAAVEGGHLHIVQWLRHPDRETEVLCRNSKEYLEQRREFTKQYPPYLYNPETFRHFFEDDLRIWGGRCQWDDRCCIEAVITGRLDILQWLRHPDREFDADGCCPWNALHCLELARHHKHSHVAAWIESQINLGT
jgi:hypothetical protein